MRKILTFSVLWAGMVLAGWAHGHHSMVWYLLGFVVANVVDLVVLIYESKKRPKRAPFCSECGEEGHEAKNCYFYIEGI